MNYKQSYLEKYARLIIQMGVNIQKGQKLIINSPVECSYFVRLAVEEAYKSGARDVFIRWNDDKCNRSRYLLAPDDVFDEFPEWNQIMLNGLTKEGAALLSVSSTDPESLKGVDINRIIRSQKAADSALKEYRERIMGSHIQWCAASIPSEAWAKKVFPNIGTEQAIESLWDAIYKASRVDENGAVENWKQHISAMKKNVQILNNFNFKYLRFYNSIGTNLEIELPENHNWGGAEETSKNGVSFLPNIPTEEIFTAPKRDGVNGKVIGSKPLVISGNIVENFSFTFEDGRVVEFSAEKGYDVLEKLLRDINNMDYLGEVALVPHDSPISNMNILFYNTLYDENASCHLALGEAYPDCVKGGSEMSAKDRLSAGLNQSDDHRDFMIGTEDMDIIGVTHNGENIQIFKNGNFAFN